MAKTIKINNRDFTGYFPDAGMRVEYTPRQGDNAGWMLDGTYTEDELALKAVVTLDCMPLTDAQLKEVLYQVLFWQYVNVEYYDPLTGANRIMSARRQVSQQTYRGQGADGNEYWTRTTITFTER